MFWERRWLACVFPNIWYSSLHQALRIRGSMIPPKVTQLCVAPTVLKFGRLVHNGTPGRGYRMVKPYFRSMADGARIGILTSSFSPRSDLAKSRLHRKLAPRPSMKWTQTFSPSLPDFQGDENVIIWPRCSIIFTFESPCFETKQIENIKVIGSSCLGHVAPNLVKFDLHTRWTKSYKIPLPERRARKICSVINN